MLRSILLVLGVWTAASVVISPLLGRSLRVVRLSQEASSAPDVEPELDVDLTTCA